MKWEKCELIAMVKGDTVDELGNPIKTEKVLNTLLARMVSITDRDLAIYGRTVTNKTVKLLFRCTDDDMAACSFVKFRGVMLSVIETEPSGRFFAVFCEKKGKV